MVSFADNLKKYATYIFDTRSFTPTFDTNGISEQANRTALLARGKERGPALIIHGIMPRAGTVYAGELLRLHSDLCAYPYQIWEVPFLQLTENVLDVQNNFFLGYRHNVGKLGEKDFLPIFGAAFMAYLHSGVPDDKRMLLKVPGVQHLDHFFSVFPYENLLVLIRDGRDVVQSTIKTWPQLRFSFVCRRWERSARMVLACHERFSQRSEGYWLARFEDAIRDPVTFVKKACEHFRLDESKYPFEKIETISLHGSSAVPVQGTVDWDPIKKPQDFNPTGRWKTWSAGKKRTFKRIAGQALMDLGYCSDLNW